MEMEPVGGTEVAGVEPGDIAKWWYFEACAVGDC